MIDGVTNFKHAAGNIVGDFFISFTDGFADAVGQAIVFGDELNQSFGETLEDIAKNALAALISGFIKLGAQMIATSVLAETIGSGTTASTLGQALIIGQAWAPAAALASLATLGGNAAVAQAGIASTIGLTRFLSFFRDGGENIMGPGGRRSDSIPAMISRGESVITADATRNNPGLATFLNNGGRIGGTTQNINVIHDGSTGIKIEQMSNDEIRIIARQENELFGVPVDPS